MTGREIARRGWGLVKRMRRPDQDNLNLVLHTLNGAAQHARMEGFRGLTEQDVAAAAPSIFHLPDGEQIRHRKSAVDKLLEVEDRVEVRAKGLKLTDDLKRDLEAVAVSGPLEPAQEQVLVRGGEKRGRAPFGGG